MRGLGELFIVLTVLAAVGVVAMVLGIGWGLWWLFTHISIMVL